jgi:hypothetical protein
MLDVGCWMLDAGVLSQNLATPRNYEEVLSPECRVLSEKNLSYSALSPSSEESLMSLDDALKQ